ncbi:MAG: hypothetical protein IK990_20790 [Ruminiclostridium sp.]|nr:hypothetical protein [Ruminiclostridium sp.]
MQGSYCFLSALLCVAFGRLDTKLITGAVCRDGGSLIIFIPEEYVPQISVGMNVTADERNFTISGISDQSFRSLINLIFTRSMQQDLLSGISV